MTNTKKFNFKIFMLAFIGIIVAFCSFISLVPQKTISSSYAVDESFEVYDFDGANIVVPTLVAKDSFTQDYSYDLVYLNFDISLTNYRLNSRGTYFNFTLDLSNCFFVYDGVKRNFGSYSTSTLDASVGHSQAVSWQDSMRYHLPIYYVTDSGPVSNAVNFNFYKIVVSHDNTLPIFGGAGVSCNTITYYDTNDHYLRFYFLGLGNDTNWVKNYGFITRTYFIKQNLSDDQYYEAGYNNGYGVGYDAGQSAGYNSGYDSGLSSGYNNGYSAGSDAGYNNGYSAGADAGYQQGYYEGLSSDNPYTFNALFGAVFDAPVSTLTGLFNFNLLGVNLLGLFTGLLTLAVIIWVIKLALGGK